MAAVFAIGGPMYAATPGRLELKGRIELPGVRGRLDHFAYAPDSNLLFVAALQADTVQVIDLANARLAASLPARAARCRVLCRAATDVRRSVQLHGVGLSLIATSTPLMSIESRGVGNLWTQTRSRARELCRPVPHLPSAVTCAPPDTPDSYAAMK
jgi:hypothetical protein